jgi:hypothetical protein
VQDPAYHHLRCAVPLEMDALSCLLGWKPMLCNSSQIQV